MEHDRKSEPPLPIDSDATAKQAEKNRKALDEVPEPGTDPLHEGP